MEAAIEDFLNGKDEAGTRIWVLGLHWILDLCSLYRFFSFGKLRHYVCSAPCLWAAMLSSIVGRSATAALNLSEALCPCCKPRGVGRKRHPLRRSSRRFKSLVEILME